MKDYIKKNFKVVSIIIVIVVALSSLVLLQNINNRNNEIEILNTQIATKDKKINDLEKNNKEKDIKINDNLAEIKKLSKEDEIAKIENDIKKLNNDKTKAESEKESVEKEIIKLEDKVITLKNEIKKLEGDVVEIKGSPKTYPAGKWYVGIGEDIAPGRYKVSNGSSNFFVNSASGKLLVNIILGSNGVSEYVDFFKLGDIIESRSSFVLTPIE